MDSLSIKTYVHGKSISYKTGLGLVEVVVAIAMISITLFALGNVSRIAFRAVDESSHRVQASFLLEEGFEALKTIRDGDWNDVASAPLDEERFLVFSGGAWSLTETETLIDGLFRRTITLHEVFRDSADSISATGVSDPYTKQADITVQWNERGKSISISSVTYITHLFSE